MVLGWAESRQVRQSDFRQGKTHDEGVPYHSTALAKYSPTVWEKELWSGSPSSWLGLLAPKHGWPHNPDRHMQEGSHPGPQKHLRHNLLLLLPHCRDLLWPPALLWLLPFHQYLTGMSSLTPKLSASNVFCNKLFPFLELMETPHELEGRSETMAGTQLHEWTQSLQGLGTQWLFCLNRLLLYWGITNNENNSNVWTHPCHVLHMSSSTQSHLCFIVLEMHWQDMLSRWSIIWRWDWSSPTWKALELTGNHWWSSSRKSRLEQSQGVS